MRRRYKAIIDTAVDAIVVNDEQGTVQSVNPAAEQIFGYPSAEVVGRNVKMLMPERYAREHDRYLETYRRTGERQIIGRGRAVEGRRKDGSEVPLHLSVTEWTAGGQRYFTGIMRDISNQRALEEQLRRQALHDDLTKLPNRRLFADHLELALAAAARHEHKVAVLVFDLDGFKEVNDTLGHAAGDQLLQVISERVRNTLRSSDTLARMGGDEFAIVQPDARLPDDVVTVAGRVLEEVARPVPVGTGEARVTASIGIAVYPEDGTNPDELVVAADEAPYRAKANRAEFRFFEPRMTEEANKRRRLEQDLRGALVNDELVLHYQPILNLQTGRFESVEALVRWQHPREGLLAPGAFIELAERSGLIRLLGNNVLEQACRQAARWHAQGLDLKVAVNLSGVQLRDPQLTDQVEQALASTGLPPHLLEFELTETIMMDPSLPATRSFLTAALERDFPLAIDDFGDACSVFTYLREPAIKRLKISQSLIGNLPDNPEAAKLVAAMIAFAQGLGREIVAEAVETEAQLQFLEQHDCDHVQGYLLCRPLPTEQVTRFLLRNEALAV